MEMMGYKFTIRNTLAMVGVVGMVSLIAFAITAHLVSSICVGVIATTWSIRKNN